MSDRVGRKPMLIMSQIGTFIGFLVMARAHSLWMLYLARILDGLTAGNLSLAQAYISDHTKPSQRARAFGLIGIAFGVGFFIGPSLTGYLAARHGMTAPIYLAACMSATSVCCTILLLRAGERRHAFADRRSAFDWRTYTTYFGRPALRARLFQFLCFIASFSLFISGFALFAERRFVWDGRPFGPREIGYLFGFVGVLGIILQGGLIGRLVKWLGEPALVAIGFVTLVVAYVGLGIVSSVALLLGVGVLAAFGNGVIRPALTSLITQEAGPHEQGTVLGITQSLMSMASIVTPVIAGVLIGRDWLMAWAWTAGAIAVVGVVASRAGFRRTWT